MAIAISLGVAILFLAFGWWILQGSTLEQAALPVFSPTNDLERALQREPLRDVIGDQLRKELLSATLLAPPDPANPHSPAIQSVAIPAWQEDEPGGQSITPPAPVRHILLCFSSRQAFENAHPGVRRLAPDSSSLQEFPAPDLLRLALEHHADVLLNPSCSLSRRFPHHTLESLLPTPRNS